MTRLTVVVRNSLYDRVLNSQRTMTYSGEEVPLPKWVTYPAIALATGSHQFPFRIIPKDEVVSIDDSPVETGFGSVPLAKRTVQIPGTKGNVYLVTIDGGHRSCTCTGYQFRKSCRHLMEAA